MSITRFLPLLTLAALGLTTSLHAAGPKKLLVVTTTEGFRHGGGIDAAKVVLPELAAQSNGELTFDFVTDPGRTPDAGAKPERKANTTDTEWEKIQAERTALEAKIKDLRTAWVAQAKDILDAAINPTNLAQYDGVIFSNTTGDNLPVDVDALTTFIKSGKAFIGMHAATDTLKHNTAYMEMINGGFAGHPWGSGETHQFINNEPSHPLVSMFDASFPWKDEIYQYKFFNPAAVRVLLSLDTGHSKPINPYHVPVSWVRDYGTGRVFYTNLGHNPETWKHATYQKHIVAGIRWALKLTDAPAAPNPEVSAQQALKAIAAVAAVQLNKDEAALEAKALAKAKADPQWAQSLYSQADSYRALPNPDPRKEPADKVAKADTAKHDLLVKLVAEIEK